jgi:antitoxin FitA
MPMIQIRNVPEPVHRELKIQAVRAGMSLSEYLLREVQRVAWRPTAEEVLERLAARRRPALDETPAEAVRAERDGT